LDIELERLLEDLHRAGRGHDAARPDRLERLRNLEPETARLLAVLARGLRATHLLELGTSNGYSTIWLADAARACEGRLRSVELDPTRISEAGDNLARAGLTAFVELRREDARDCLAKSDDAAWDLVFLDAEREAYVDYWPDLVRTLRGAGVLVVDNVISHAEEVADFRALVASDRRVMQALVPTGAGALLIVKHGPRADTVRLAG
jgi:predicted O-methyltransferase YrrM